MKIYTKTGDAGETSLLGGQRVKKSCLEIDAIGEVDELNASIGILISLLDSPPGQLITVQHQLFVVGSNIADVQMQLGSVPKLCPEDITALEQWIDAMETELPKLTQFILPGGHTAAAQSFLARAICRRAERRVVDVQTKYPALDPFVKQYLNRLSDALFVLGRWINKKSDSAEVAWKK